MLKKRIALIVEVNYMKMVAKHTVGMLKYIMENSAFQNFIQKC